MVIHSYGKQRIIFNDIQTLVSTTTTEKQARLFDEGFKKNLRSNLRKKGIYIRRNFTKEIG